MRGWIVLLDYLYLFLELIDNYTSIYKIIKMFFVKIQNYLILRILCPTKSYQQNIYTLHVFESSI